MKAPKCPKCGKEHYSTQRCSAEAACGPRVKSPSTNAVPVDVSSPDSPDQSNVGSVGSRGNVESPDAPTPTIPPAPPAGISTSSGQITNEVHWESSSGDQDAPASGEGRRGKRHAGDLADYEEENWATPASMEAKDAQAGVAPGPLTPAEKQADMPSALAPIAAAVEIILPTVKRAITAAEKQKAYRERLKDDPGAYEEYLEANKLRMRKKRE